MVNYQLGKIYRIVCRVTGLVYIGSTCCPTLAQRLKGHVSNYKGFKSGKGHFITSFKVLEADDYFIELVALSPCNSKDELHRFEGDAMRNTECVNQREAGRSSAMRYVDNRETKCQYQKAYYASNVDAIIKQTKQYRIINAVGISEYQKQYSIDNAASLSEYRKKYRIRNTDKISKYKTEKHNCDCGGKYTTTNMAQHLKSKIHTKFSETLKVNGEQIIVFTQLST